MINDDDLTAAFVAKLQALDQLVLLLGSVDDVVGYFDSGADRNNMDAAIYEMKPGTVMVMWEETVLTEGEMEAWVHRVNFHVRAPRGQSSQSVIATIVNGIPVPGDGLRWRYCPVLSGVLPTEVKRIYPQKDSEGVDYYTIACETRETGDL
jgi:hypothetical protein